MRSALFAIALFACGCHIQATPGSNPATENVELDWPVGHFSLTERSGKTLTDSDLVGTVWVASFIFTRCNGPCPAVTSTVARLQADLKDEPGVKFVTITVDPSRDDLAALRAYADNRKADPDRWLFLTGDEATIHKLMREQFKQGVVRKTGAEATPGDEFGHSTRLLVVDKKGVIRAVYDGLPNERLPELFEPEFARMKDRIRKLARE